MGTVLRLKSPIHVTFSRDGHTREEVIRYVHLRRPEIDEKNWTEIIGSGHEEAEKFARRVDNPHDTIEELIGEIAGYDLNEAMRDAYTTARRHALDFLWAKAQQDDPEAKPYRGPDGVYSVNPRYVPELLAHGREPIPDRTPDVSMEDHHRMLAGEYFE